MQEPVIETTSMLSPEDKAQLLIFVGYVASAILRSPDPIRWNEDLGAFLDKHLAMMLLPSSSMAETPALQKSVAEYNADILAKNPMAAVINYNAL